ncbi:MAG: hypothetical protein IPG83_06220 [Novosphingobium sp.]|nr:hypothetical protein [Novosphingobium sp.]
MIVHFEEGHRSFGSCPIAVREKKQTPGGITPTAQVSDWVGEFGSHGSQICLVDGLQGLSGHLSLGLFSRLDATP